VRCFLAKQDDYIALEINGEPVALTDVVRQAKFRAQLEFLEDAVDSEIIRQAAARQQLALSDEELQKAADDFRIQHHLYDSETTEAWFTKNHLSQEEWESSLAEVILEKKLCDRLAEGKIEQHFAENRLSFDAATLAYLIVNDEGVARELRAQIVDDGADFHALARQFSIDDSTRNAGGYAGLVRRTEMEAAVEAAVFGADSGEVIGPVKTDLGWSLIKVEALLRGKLDDATRGSIRAQLFDDWLQEQRRKARIRYSLLEISPDD
jgi:putative peptide maturation system protein